MFKAVFGILLCLNSIKCQNKMETFAVNGQYSDITDFPHSACLGISPKIENEFGNKTVRWTCGSSILTQRILLTAAHCVYRCEGVCRILAEYGDENRNNAKKILASTYLYHPQYSEAEAVRFDIALVIVQQPLEMNERVRRVAVLQNPPYGDIGWIAGWGRIDELQENSSTNLLMQINQRIMNRVQCEKALGKLLPKGTICGGDKKSSSYISKGDSGCALVVRGFIQVGIVSCKTPESRSIAIYTDVGYFYSWIAENAPNLYCNGHDDSIQKSTNEWFQKK